MKTTETGFINIAASQLTGTNAYVYNFEAYLGLCNLLQKLSLEGILITLYQS